MKRKSSPANPTADVRIVDWQYVQEQDLWLYAPLFHTAARRVAAAFEPGSGPFPDFSACPVVFMYRHAVELQLKAMIFGPAGNFLQKRPDWHSLNKTHSISWMARFICQMVSAANLDEHFKCDGVENLADFKSVIDDLNRAGPGTFLYPVKDGAFSVPEFAAKMDALLVLLESTADALAATWDLINEPEEPEPGHPGGMRSKPTIH